MEKRIAWRYILPYLGLPVLCLSFWLAQRTALDPLVLLRIETLVAVGYLIALSDLKSKRIPNSLVMVLLAAWLATILPQLLWDTEAALDALKEAAGGFLLAGGVFLAVYYLSKKGLGGGDVKFMAVAGLYLGAGLVMPVMLIGSVLAAVAGLGLVLLKRLKKSDSIPLAPFLYGGILIIIFLL